MALSIVGEWGDRYDRVVAAMPGGRWATANDRALFLWSADGPGAPEVHDELRPGPLVWCERSQALHWGPTVVGADGPEPSVLLGAALPDVGSAGSREYELVAGALGDGGTRALLVLRHRRSRVAGGPSEGPGPDSRVAIETLDQDARVQGGRFRIVADDGPLPTAISWGDGPLLLGRTGAIVEAGNGVGIVVERPLVPAAGSAPRCLAVATQGLAAAGLADGTVVAWVLGEDPGDGRAVHTGPVLSLAWAPDGTALASGGRDGVVRIGRSGSSADTIDLDAPIGALAWLDDGRLVAVAGDSGGHVVLLSS